MTERITVHVWLPGQPDPVVAGEFSHDQKNKVGRFQYEQSYLDAEHPPLAPDMALRFRPVTITGGHAIFPLFLDAGPDTWGRHLLSKRLERDVSEIEALSLCPIDGVGNIALGELTPERTRILSIDEFLTILANLEAGGAARSNIEEQVLDAAQNGTSLGGTKPKLTVSRDGVQYLAKFPEPGDSRWLPHIECAMLKLSDACGVRTCKPEVWTLPDGRAALLVKRFDRVKLDKGVGRIGYVSAHALLRIDMMAQARADILQYGTQGFTAAGLRRSYVSLASEMAKWCGGKVIHIEERKELWRRIVFNALILNLDDHSRNHGLLCDDMREQKWRLAPAFDLVPASAFAQHPALAMAYRYVPPSKRGRQDMAPRLVTRIDVADLLAAAVEHYGYDEHEAAEYLKSTAALISREWQVRLADEGVPEAEMTRFTGTFEFAGSI